MEKINNGHGSKFAKYLDTKTYQGLVIYNPTGNCNISFNHSRVGIDGRHTTTHSYNCVFLKDNICINNCRCQRNNLKYIFISSTALHLKKLEQRYRHEAIEAEKKLKIYDKYIPFNNNFNKDITTKDKVDTIDKLYNNSLDKIMFHIRFILSNPEAFSLQGNISITPIFLEIGTILSYGITYTKFYNDIKERLTKEKVSQNILPQEQERKD